MSLIGDALRKARQEAAERESDRKGILFSAKIADSPARSNLGLGLALGAIIAVIATVAGGAAVWWVLNGSRNEGPARDAATLTDSAFHDSAPKSASEAASVPVPVPDETRNSDQHQQSAVAAAAATEAAQESVGGASMPRDPDADGGRIANGPPTDPGTPSTKPTTESESVHTGGSGDNESTSVETPVPQTVEPETGFIGMENGEEIYLLQADLGDVSLSLDFLVFREVDPFAEINGVEVHLGAMISGYRVKDIERDRVRLSNGRRTIVLRAP